MRTLNRRVLALVLAGGLVLLGGGVALAYWTSTGSGTGSAAAASSVANLQVVQTSVVGNLAPGVAAQVLSGNFNNTGTGPLYVGTVTASISGVVKAGGAPAGTCDATDFVLSNPVAIINAEIPVGTGKGSWSGPTLTFNDKSGSQDACKGATVNISYVASGVTATTTSPTDTTSSPTSSPTNT